MKKIRTIEVDGTVYVREDCIGEYLSFKEWDKNNFAYKKIIFDIDELVHRIIKYSENLDIDNHEIKIFHDYVMIREDILKKEIKKIDIDNFLKFLVINGRLIKNSTKRNKHKTTIGGVQANYIKIIK